MVIDDDGEMRAVLRDFLAREGFDVHEEAGGEAVVVAIESLTRRSTFVASHRESSLHEMDAPLR